MKAIYLAKTGAFQVIPTRTRPSGTNTDRDALGKAIETVKPLVDIPGAPCQAAAVALAAAAKTIIEWIETGKEASNPNGVSTERG